MAGMPAEANARAIRSFRAWCLADLPGARLQQSRGDHVRRPVSRNGMDAGRTKASPGHKLLLLLLVVVVVVVGL